MFLSKIIEAFSFPHDTLQIYVTY